MRYAILADIHGNLEALQAVIDACRQQRVHQFLCVGDTVGYGANPKECLDLLRELECVSVAGNHDWAVGGRLNASYFTEDGKAAISWTRSNIPFEYFNYLNALEPVLKNDDAILVHGCLDKPENFEYLHGISKASDTFDVMDRPVCFIGHTHVAKILIQQGDQIFDAHTSEVEVDPDCKYIVNPGSVGQPRDGNPMAAYCIYDKELEMLELKRMQYDIAMTQQKMIEAGLPENLAKRLSVGK